MKTHMNLFSLVLNPMWEKNLFVCFKSFMAQKVQLGGLSVLASSFSLHVSVEYICCDQKNWSSTLTSNERIRTYNTSLKHSKAVMGKLL